MTRRTASQLRADRRAILACISSDIYVKAPEGVRQSDLDALVKSGDLLRIIRDEWDRQRGHAANLFGGAGVMRRRRAYYRRVK